MFQWIIDFSVRNKFIIALFTLLLAAVGIWSLSHIPIDAVPDITNNQVQVVTTSPTLAPQEVEQLITYPIEVAMANLPGVSEIRSISRFGLSVVTIVFDDNVPVLEARQYVREQISIAEASIPPALGRPELMPITTGLGEIYQYVLMVDPAYSGQYDAMELRTIQDWIVKRQLNGIAGIIDVSSFGGYLKQYEVSVHPGNLQSLDVSLTEVYDALAQNNENSGGSYIEKQQNAFYIRTAGLVGSAEDIEQIVVTTRQGRPVLIGDVATVRFGHMPRFGAMTMDGLGETVGGITLMLKGASSSDAIQNVHDRVVDIQKILPPGISLYAYLDRSELVTRTMYTASKNLIEGGLIVIFVLVLLLGNWRAGVIVASVIPLSMLFAIILMNVFGVSANLMSLGAIDFGIVVDGAVIIVESVLHIIYTNHVGKRLTQREMDSVISGAAGSIYKSAAFGVLIILVVFIPIISLTGIEGKMFRPMALTVSFAILGALLLSVTYVPMLSALMLRKDIREHHTFSDRLVGWLRGIYRPTLEYALRIPYLVIGIAVVLLAATIFAFSRMGAEFLPTLEEGDLAMQMSIQPGSSLTESVATTTKAESILLQHFPEIKHVVSKIGTAEIPTDPMAVEDADIMIIMKPRKEWTSADSREELVEMMKEKLAVIPGASFEFTQPIQLRFNELMTGAKADVAVKIFGEDVDLLADLAKSAAAIIETIDGAGDVKVEQTEGFPQLMVNFNRQKIAEYGLDITTLNMLIRTAYAGEIAGVVYEGERKFDLAVRLDPAFRHEVDLDKLYVHIGGSTHIPLSEVASVVYKEGPMQISREDTKRRITIGVNVRQRDVASLVADIQSSLQENLPLPPGYSIQYGGQFENLEAARARLSLAVPVALLMIFLLLYFAFGSFKYAILIYSAVPLSAIGGVAALLLRGMPFSISAGVGFIALFGVAVLNGIVLISYFNKLREEGKSDPRDIVIEGGLVRLRPVVMTAAVASLGFLPMALSGSAGAEVQKPLATVVIGGLITATFLTLVVLPVLYYITSGRRTGYSSKLAVVALLLLLPTGLTAQSPPLTLEAVLQHARDNHPLLQQSALAVDKAYLMKRQAWDLPPLDVNIEYGQINAAAQDLRVNIVQGLGVLPAHIQRARLASTNIAFAEADMARQQALLLNEVEMAWFAWLYHTQQVATYRQMEQLYGRIAEKSRLRNQTGDISGLDMQLALTAVAQARQATATAQMALQAATTQLQQVAWLESWPVAAADTLPVVPWPGELSIATPTLLLAPFEAQQQVLQQQWKLEQSQFFPNLHIGYFNQQLEKVGGFQGILAGATIPLWPLPQQSKVQQAALSMQQAAAATRQAAQEYQTTAMQLVVQANLLYEQVSNTLPMLKQQASTLREAAGLEWEQGTIDQLRYLQLLEQALQLELQYLDGIHQYNQTLITWSLYAN